MASSRTHVSQLTLLIVRGVDDFKNDFTQNKIQLWNAIFCPVRGVLDRIGFPE